jgi:hypothetical protein
MHTESGVAKRFLLLTLRPNCTLQELLITKSLISVAELHCQKNKARHFFTCYLLCGAVDPLWSPKRIALITTHYLPPPPLPTRTLASAVVVRHPIFLMCPLKDGPNLKRPFLSFKGRDLSFSLPFTPIRLSKLCLITDFFVI